MNFFRKATQCLLISSARKAGCEKHPKPASVVASTHQDTHHTIKELLQYIAYLLVCNFLCSFRQSRQKAL